MIECEQWGAWDCCERCDILPDQPILCDECYWLEKFELLNGI